MKKTILIIASTALVMVSGYFVWRSTFGSCGSSCASNGEMTSGNYSLKMSMCCEQACSAKNIDASKVTAQSAAKTGDYARCPVSGVVFLVTEGSSKISSGSQTAYTCCASCVTIFNEEPGEYAGNIN